MQAELLLHALLFYDRLPALCLLAGIAAHVSYLRLLKPFPYLELLSVNGLTSIGLLIASSVLWIRHFMSSYYTGEQGPPFLHTWRLVYKRILHAERMVIPPLFSGVHRCLPAHHHRPGALCLLPGHQRRQCGAAWGEPLSELATFASSVDAPELHVVCHCAVQSAIWRQRFDNAALRQWSAAH